MSRIIVEPLPRFNAEGRLSEARRGFWQEVARRMVPGAAFSYDEYGGPVITGSDLHLSVAHSRTAVAVMVSATPCGVDLETPDRNFHRVASKYLDEEEMLLSAHPDFEAVAWCAKEAMYKLWRRGDHTLPQFRITSYDHPSGHVAGILPDGTRIGLTVTRELGNIVVHCTL